MDTILINSKVLFDGEMQGFVDRIGHHESKRLYDEFASGTNVLHKRFNHSFLKFCEWNKGYVQKRCSLKFIHNLFTYEARVSLYFGCNYCLKAKLIKT